MNKNLKSSTSMLASRIAVAGVAVIAGVIAANPNSSILTLVGFAWAGFGSAFGPVVVASLYWRRLNMPGAAAGIIVGAIVSFAWGLSPLTDTLYEIVPGVLASTIAMVAVSLMTKAPSPHIVEEFDHAAAEARKPAAPAGTTV